MNMLTRGAAAFLLAVASAACGPVPAEPAAQPAARPAASSSTPSQEWLDLQQRSDELDALMAAASAAVIEDPARAAELVAEAQAIEVELRQYLVEHPDADAPCEVWLTWAPIDLQQAQPNRCTGATW